MALAGLQASGEYGLKRTVCSVRGQELHSYRAMSALTRAQLVLWSSLTLVPRKAAVPPKVDLGAVPVPDVALACVQELLASHELGHAGLICRRRRILRAGLIAANNRRKRVALCFAAGRVWQAEALVC